MEANEIIVLGSINQDVILEMERFPRPGESLLSKPVVYANGGKGANQAVAVARLGGDPLFIGKVGGDTFGECLKQDLAATGVDTRLLKIAENTSTGLALIMLAAGENTIVVSPGANGEVSLADVDSVLAYLRRARILMVQLEIPLDTVAYAMRLARQHGLQVILDPGPAQTCPEEILRLADYLTPNETEAAMLTGEQVCDLTSARRAARHLMRFTHQGVVVKLGSAGVLAMHRGEEFFVEPIPVTVRDTTAAGDAFCAALAVSLLHGFSSLDAVHFANLVGSLAVTRLGAQPSLPTRQEVAAFAIQHRPELRLPWIS